MPRTNKSSARKTSPKETRTSKKRRVQTRSSPEYEEYLERYAELGEGRPRLTLEEFDKYDDELLDLLDLSGGKLTDEQVIRINELEYLLIDTE